MTWIPLIAVLMLFLAGLGLPFLKPHQSLLRVSLGVQGLASVMLAFSLPLVLKLGPVSLPLGEVETLSGMHWAYGPAEILMAAVFSTIASLIMGTAVFTIEKEIPPGRIPLFVLLFHLIHGSVLAIILTGHLFNGFLLLELSALASAGMIALKDQEKNIKASMKYLLFSTLGSGLVLMGIASLHAPTGLMTLNGLQEAMPGLLASNPQAVHGSLMFFMTGLGIKGALFPLHLWLPDAHSFAPTPVSALLSSLVIKGPPLLLIKLVSSAYAPAVPSLGLIFNALAATAATGILVASLRARSQTHLKRMVAYSSVSQIGYVFLGIGLGTPAGIVMALYHMIAHGLAKSCLFLSAGAFIEQTGRHDINDFKGIGREMPFTLGFFTLSAFSMVGIPMLPGFISKFALALAAIDSGKFIFLGVLLISSLLSAFYYFPIIINGYFGEENLEGKVLYGKVKPFREMTPMIGLSLLMVLAGFLSGRFLDILELGLHFG